jgi:hypothetical protein
VQRQQGGIAALVTGNWLLLAASYSGWLAAYNALWTFAALEMYERATNTEAVESEEVTAEKRNARDKSELN